MNFIPSGLKVMILCTIWISHIHPAYTQTITPEDLLNPTEVNHEIFGFNGEYMIDGCFSSDDPYSNPQLPYNSFYLREGCKQIVQDVNPGVLRFPGGTTANFYHFNGNGFGIDIGETIGNSIGPIDLAQELLIPENYIGIFSDLAVQTNSKVIFTINIYTHFRAGGAVVTDPSNPGFRWRFDENMAALQFLVDQGVDLIGVELGNELYRYSELTSIFTYATAIDKYLTLAETYTDSIKARFPGVKVGVPVAIHQGWANQNWNTKMQEADFADGFVIHEYERAINDNCGTLEDRDAFFNCAAQQIDHFFETDLDAIIDTYAAMYSGDKELWLTEWGISNATKAANTFFDATFVFRYWNKIMEIEKRYPGKIPFAHRHNLIAQGYSYSAFSQKFIGDAPELDYSGKSIRASAYPSLMMSEIYDGTHQFIGKTTLAGCDAWIYTQGGNSYRVALHNDSSAARSLSIAEIEAVLNTNGLSFEQSSSLHAEHLYDAAGINYFESSGENLPNELQYQAAIPANSGVSMDIEGRSINLISIVQGTHDPLTIDTVTVQANDCLVELFWTVTSDEPGIRYVISANDLEIDTLASTGHHNLVSYSHELLWEDSGSVVFEITALDTLSMAIDSQSAPAIVLDCAAPLMPFFEGVNVSINGNCEIEADWLVQDDLAGTVINLFAWNAAGDTVLSTTMISDGSGLYSAALTAPANGPYNVGLQLSYNSNHTNTATPVSVQVDCVPAPLPAVMNYTITEGPDCHFTLQWTVHNETPQSTYIWYREFEDAVDIHAIEVSLQFADTLAYETSFTPEIGGDYTFYMLHFVDGVLVDTLSDLYLEVTCLPALMPTLTFSDLSIAPEGCLAAFTWLVDHDDTDADYVIYGSVNDTVLSEIGVIPSNGGGVYLFPYVPGANETFRTQVFIRYADTVIESSAVYTLDITCVNAPDPEIVYYDVIGGTGCEQNISWVVTNERATSVYKVMASLDGGPFAQIHEEPATFNSPLKTYAYAYTPALNGTYSFYVERHVSGEYITATNTVQRVLSCFEPALGSFALESAAPCTQRLQWEVSNEVAGAGYDVFVSHESAIWNKVATISSAGNSGTAVYGFDHEPSENGLYDYQVLRTENGFTTDSSTILTADVGCVCQTAEITLDAGWNMISSNVLPDQPDMLDIFEALNSDVIIVKDGEGKLVMPSIGINQVGHWSVEEGYVVKMNNSTTLTMGCTAVQLDEVPIPLSAGWNIISFPGTAPMNAASALASLGNNLSIAKNNSGKIYWPATGLNTIGDLLPGQGYQVKVVTADTLWYPSAGTRLAQQAAPDMSWPLERLRFEENTGNNATLLLPENSIAGLEYGDEIGIITQSGQLAGSVRYQGATTALVAWGTDALENNDNFLSTGEAFRLIVSRNADGRVYPVEDLVLEGTPAYVPNGISIVKQGRLEQAGRDLPVKGSVVSYPNPATDQLYLEVSLPGAAQASLKLFDRAGNVVGLSWTGTLEPGQSRIDLGVETLPTGEYFYRLENSFGVLNGNFIVVH